MEKRLYRSKEGRIFAGICAGLGEYLDVDPVVIRLIWLFFCCMGFGILAYLIAILIIPAKPNV